MSRSIAAAFVVCCCLGLGACENNKAKTTEGSAAINAKECSGGSCSGEKAAACSESKASCSEGTAGKACCSEGQKK